MLDPTIVPGYSFTNRRLRFNDQLVVGNSSDLRTRLITEFHTSPIGGHSGRRGTFERLSKFFYWPTMRTDVVTFVKECEVCQLNKHETRSTPGLL